MALLGLQTYGNDDEESDNEIEDDLDKMDVLPDCEIKLPSAKRFKNSDTALCKLSDNDQLEESVKRKKWEEDEAEKPPSKKKLVGPVKITLPDLPEFDSDEDESKPAKVDEVQVDRKGKGQSTLLSSLPAPKLVSQSKSLLGNLSKKGPAPISDKRQASKGSIPFMPRTLDPKLKQSTAPSAAQVDMLPADFFGFDATDEADSDVTAVSMFGDGGLRPGPSSFTPDFGRGMQDNDWQENGDTCRPGPSMILEDEDQHYTEVESVDSDLLAQLPPDIQKTVMADGKGRFDLQMMRGRGPIEIVDVSLDGVIQQNKQQLLKNVTDDSTRAMLQSKAGVHYTSKQKSKHQIVYLAHMAKEREAELQNQWSINKLSKAQTRAKYGF